MDNTKKTKKELRTLISETLLTALTTLPLPELTKKGKKQLSRNSKKLANIYRDQVKREEKKKKRLEKATPVEKPKAEKKPSKSKVEPAA